MLCLVKGRWTDDMIAGPKYLRSCYKEDGERGVMGQGTGQCI